MTDITHSLILEKRPKERQRNTSYTRSLGLPPRPEFALEARQLLHRGNRDKYEVWMSQSIDCDIWHTCGMWRWNSGRICNRLSWWRSDSPQLRIWHVDLVTHFPPKKPDSYLRRWDEEAQIRMMPGVAGDWYSKHGLLIMAACRY